MATLTITATKDYRVAPGNAEVNGQNITSVVFNTAAISQGSFSSTQFGGGSISNTVVITADNQTNVFYVNVATGASFSAAGWTFSNWSAADSVTIDGNSDAETITGSLQKDAIYGGAGADRLDGGGGDDQFFLFTGDLAAGETIIGGSGADLIFMVDRTTFDFRPASVSGVERLQFGNSGAGLNIAEVSGTQIGSGGFTAVQGAGSSFIDRLNVYGTSINLASVAFTAFDTADAVNLVSTGASASIIGSSVADSITGGSGADALAGNDGNDTINGGDGTNSFEGGGGTDVLLGGAGDDSFSYFTGIDIGASESISGAGGTNDRIVLLADGLFDFTVANISGVEKLEFSSSLAAEATARFTQSQLSSGAIREFISVAGLASKLEVRNVTSLDLTSATFSGWGAGASTYLEARTTGGTITGSLQNDVIAGLGGSDTLSGGNGNDTLSGGLSSDSLNGGDGYDFASFLNAASGVTARLDYPSLNTGEAAGDSYTSIEGLIGSQFSDFLLVGDGQANYIAALDGDDYAAGEAGNDTILGGEGNDQFWGGTGADSLDGGNGYDIARYDFAASGVVARLDGGANAGEAAGDTYANIEALYGSAFGDYLIGDSAGNVLAGLGGADLLYGLAGNDILLGGGGADAFAFNTAGFGTDTVLDFATTAAAGANHDYVDFRGIGAFSSFAITQVGADTHIVTNHGTVILQGITAGTLVAGDFLF